MKKYSKLLLSSLMILGLVGVNACDDNEEVVEPTEKPTIQLDTAAATKVVEAEGKIVVNFSGTAPEGAENVVVTSDADENFSITFPLDGATEFNQDYNIDVSEKTSGTETFTFTVTDSLDQTASANFVATYVEHIYRPGDVALNAFDIAFDDNLSISSAAYISIFNPKDGANGIYSRQNVINAGEDQPAIDLLFFRDDLANDGFLLPSGTDRAEAALFVEILNNKITLDNIVTITSEAFDAINDPFADENIELDLDAAYQATLDAIAAGEAADDINLGKIDGNLYYGATTSNGTIIVLRAIYIGDVADVEATSATLTFVAFR
ncbi:MAG: hypothetical protein H7A32_00615 [Deltaproteobacteria bacterium]|nr:hypothetical protein [Deltaproteobacteria bacterium]